MRPGAYRDLFKNRYFIRTQVRNHIVNIRRQHVLLDVRDYPAVLQALEILCKIRHWFPLNLAIWKQYVKRECEDIERYCNWSPGTVQSLLADHNTSELPERCGGFWFRGRCRRGPQCNADDVRSDELNVHSSSSRMGHISERQGKSEGVCREFDGLAPSAHERSVRYVFS
jgi:hypothetical protein